MSSRSRHARVPSAASHINPLLPQSTAKIESACFFLREDNQMVWNNPRGTIENQRTTQLTYMALAGNRTGVFGERRALYAQAKRDTHYEAL